MSVIDSHPATRVVVATKLSGRIVTQLYFALPELIMIVVATHNATAANNWFAIPNMGQIVEIDPDQMKAPQAATTSAEVMIEPGSQFGSSSLRWKRPPNSPTRKR